MTGAANADAGNGANGAGVPGDAASALNVPPAPPPFYESFQDAGVKEYASKAGFKSAEDVAKLAQRFDAFKDADPANLIALPKEAKADAIMPILERLGAPKDAAEYKLDAIEGVDKDMAGKAAAWFQKAGLLPWQAALIAGEQMADAKVAADAMAKEEQAAVAREDAELKVQWPGTEYAAKMELAKRAAKAAGVDADTISYLESGMGFGGVMKMFAFFGSKMKEGDFIDASPSQNQGGKSALERLYPNDVAKDRAAR